MMFGERGMRRNDAHRAQRNLERRERREDRAHGDYRVTPTGVEHTCARCEGVFDEVDMVPGEGHCLHCHMAVEADLEVAQHGLASWGKAAAGYVLLQILAAGTVAWFYSFEFFMPAFGAHLFALIFAVVGSAIAMNHAKQAPEQHWVRHPLVVLHGLAALAWLVSPVLAFLI